MAAVAGIGFLTKRWESHDAERTVAAAGNNLLTSSDTRLKDAQSDQSATTRSVSHQGSRTRVTLAGEVPAALTRAKKLNREEKSNEPVTLTVVLKRTDQEGFEKFLEGVQDPQSQSYRQYLNPREQADRFGPASQIYQEVSEWLDQ
ncbi:MAG TPA: protease pro-enzyme activation domain-containing protein, partial [Pyrinomonadaceae bacterium]|nr:protease pro-enzyme activation domain-containing protein [Pyrinomonadaceae bacterium]